MEWEPGAGHGFLAIAVLAGIRKTSALFRDGEELTRETIEGETDCISSAPAITSWHKSRARSRGVGQAQAITAVWRMGQWPRSHARHRSLWNL
jgi:hypothetical protein